MNLLNYINKINRQIKINSNKYLSYEIQRDFLYRLPQPKDDIERSYFQYKCQSFVAETKITITIKNMVSIIIFIYYWFKLYGKNNNNNIKSSNVLIGSKKLLEVVPNIFIHNLICIDIGLKMSLNKEDKKILKYIIKRYPFSWFFILKNLIKIATYSYAIENHNPNVIISSCEYSFSSSLLTYYCEQKNIEHINIMHGEKIFDITDAFCRFSKFYIWDEYYVNLFYDLRANKSLFLVENQFLLNKINFNKIITLKKIYYKFYLAYETKESLSVLHNIVEFFLKNNLSVKLRPHPTYTNLKMLNTYFDDELIENFNDVDIITSILSSKNVIAVGSTVLYLAYLLDVSVIIDDLSNIKRYNYFKNNKYIMFAKKHQLLSSEIKNLN